MSESKQKTCCLTYYYKKLIGSQKSNKKSKYSTSTKEYLTTKTTNNQDLLAQSPYNLNKNIEMALQGSPYLQQNMSQQNRQTLNINDKNEKDYQTHFQIDSQTMPLNNNQCFQQIYNNYQKGRLAIAKQYMYKFLQREHGDEDKAYYLALMGQICISSKHYKQAVGWLNKSLQIYKAQQQIYFQQMITIYNNLGLLYQQQQNYSQSIQYYKKCLNIMNKYLNKLDQRIFMVQLNLTHLLLQIKNESQSIKMVEQLKQKKTFLPAKQNIWLFKQIQQLQKQVKNIKNKSQYNYKQINKK